MELKSLLRPSTESRLESGSGLFCVWLPCWDGAAGAFERSGDWATGLGSGRVVGFESNVGALGLGSTLKGVFRAFFFDQIPALLRAARRHLQSQ